MRKGWPFPFLLFQGVSPQSEKQAGFFRGIFLDNAKSISELYGQAEELLTRVDKELRAKQDWTALGNLDLLEAVIEDRCKTPEDFESNFK